MYNNVFSGEKYHMQIVNTSKEIAILGGLNKSNLSILFILFLQGLLNNWGPCKLLFGYWFMCGENSGVFCGFSRPTERSVF